MASARCNGDPPLCLENDLLLDAALSLLSTAHRGGVPFVLGITGAQGSGKSTLAAMLGAYLEAQGRRVAILSIDDLYLTRVERVALAAEVHPLFVTRGPPGTHDVELGLKLMAALDRGEVVALPRFDKAADDRAPPAAWQMVAAGVEIVLFEGWCVGACPEPAGALTEPANELERAQDSDGRWRTYANTALGGAYQHLFARLDAQILLAAPDFSTVHKWRLQQEEELRAAVTTGAGLMDARQIERFIQHYERLTRWILAEMPRRADLVVELAPDRSVRRLVTRA